MNLGLHFKSFEYLPRLHVASHPIALTLRFDLRSIFVIIICTLLKISSGLVSILVFVFSIYRFYTNLENNIVTIYRHIHCVSQAQEGNIILNRNLIHKYDKNDGFLPI